MARYRKKGSLVDGIIGFIILLVIGAGLSHKSNPSLEALYSQMLNLVLTGIVIVVAFVVIRNLYRDWQLSRSGINEIDKMGGTEFEQRLMVLFRNLGYKVEHIGHTGDAGVDLIIERDGRKTAVQAKRWDEHITEAAVQQVHTGRDYYKCDQALIVTNNYYTLMAQEVARKTNVELWNRKDLIKILLSEQDQIHASRLVARNQNQRSWVDIASHWLAKIPLEKPSLSSSQVQQPSPEPVHDQAPSTKPNPILVKYITGELNRKESWTNIRESLRQAGWKEDAINVAFYAVFNSSPDPQMISANTT